MDFSGIHELNALCAKLIPRFLGSYVVLSIKTSENFLLKFMLNFIPIKIVFVMIYVCILTPICEVNIEFSANNT